MWKWLAAMTEAECDRDWNRGLLTATEYYARLGKLPADADFELDAEDYAEIARLRAAS